MAQASRDENRIPTLLGVSSSGGVTPITVYVDPTTHRLYVDATVTGGSTFSVVDGSAFTAGISSYVPLGGFYNATIDTVISGTGAAVAIDAKRNMFVVLRDAAGNARGLNVDANGAIAVTATNGTASNLKVEATVAAAQTLATVTTVSTLIGSDVAHDAADSGNPHKIGARAATSPKGITLVANGDRTDLLADADGMLMVKLNTSSADVLSERVSNTDGTSTAFTNFSAVAGTKNYVTAYSLFRTDAGTTPIYVDFRDGTAGTVLWSVVLPPNGGANMASAVPLFKTTANTALAYDVSAATTTVFISVNGFQSKT